MNATNSIPKAISDSSADKSRRRRLWAISGLILALFLVGTVAAFILSSYPLVRGYANHSYIPDGDYTIGVDVAPEPTDKAVESKLWHHDGTWWAVMWNPDEAEYHIYRLNIADQEWVDTGVYVDHRLNSRSDVLWDEPNNRLYIATHRKQENPSNTNSNPDNWGYMQAYEYDSGSWAPVDGDDTLGDGEDVITNYIVESLVIDLDSNGRMWATSVVRAPNGDPAQYYVAVNYSQPGDPTTYPIAPQLINYLPDDAGQVLSDDISGLVAFEDDDGPKIGLLWSNQRTGEFYFAWRNDSDPVNDNWVLDPQFETLKSSVGTISADDHMNFAVTPAGDLLAIVKTSANLDPDNEDTLIGIFARKASDGSWSWHPVSPSDSFDTRPLVLYNESNQNVYGFTVSSTGGGEVCYQAAELPADIADLAFPPGGCDPSDPFSSEVRFIAHYDGGFENISNPTSTKQNVTDATGMVVLASDDVNGHVYVHNMEGGGAPNQPPAATATPRPGGEETDVYLPYFVYAP